MKYFLNIALVTGFFFATVIGALADSRRQLENQVHNDLTRISMYNVDLSGLSTSELVWIKSILGGQGNQHVRGQIKTILRKSEQKREQPN